MDAAQEAVAAIVAKRAGKRPPKRASAKKAQFASPPDAPFPPEAKTTAEGRNPDGTFAKGYVGGPGRPSLADAILKVLAEDDERSPGHSKVEAVARATVGLAMKGSIGHVQLIIDRTDGKVTQALEVTGKDGGPVAHDFSLRLAEYAEVALAAVAEAAGSGDAAGDVPADGAGEPVHPAPAVQ